MTVFDDCIASNYFNSYEQIKWVEYEVIFINPETTIFFLYLMEKRI